MSVPEGTFCTPCKREGYLCAAFDYDGNKIPCCVYHLDGEKCSHKNSPRTLIVNADNVAQSEKKQMAKPEAPSKHCACGCGKILSPGSRWTYIRGHKRDPGGLPNQREQEKKASPSELTISQLITKFDADIAELQRAKDLLVKYAGK